MIQWNTLLYLTSNVKQYLNVTVLENKFLRKEKQNKYTSSKIIKKRKTYVFSIVIDIHLLNLRSNCANVNWKKIESRSDSRCSKCVCVNEKKNGFIENLKELSVRPESTFKSHYQLWNILYLFQNILYIVGNCK